MSTTKKIINKMPLDYYNQLQNDLINHPENLHVNLDPAFNTKDNSQPNYVRIKNRNFIDHQRIIDTYTYFLFHDYIGIDYWVIQLGIGLKTLQKIFKQPLAGQIQGHTLSQPYNIMAVIKTADYVSHRKINIIGLARHTLQNNHQPYFEISTDLFKTLSRQIPQKLFVKAQTINLIKLKTTKKAHKKVGLTFQTDFGTNYQLDTDQAKINSPKCQLKYLCADLKILLKSGFQCKNNEIYNMWPDNQIHELVDQIIEPIKPLIKTVEYRYQPFNQILFNQLAPKQQTEQMFTSLAFEVESYGLHQFHASQLKITKSAKRQKASCQTMLTQPKQATDILPSNQQLKPLPQRRSIQTLMAKLPYENYQYFQPFEDRTTIVTDKAVYTILRDNSDNIKSEVLYLE